jgi:hypothetical protein
MAVDPLGNPLADTVALLHEESDARVLIYSTDGDIFTKVIITPVGDAIITESKQIRIDTSNIVSTDPGDGGGGGGGGGGSDGDGGGGGDGSSGGGGTVIPEPAALALMGLAVPVLAVLRWRRRMPCI